VDTGRFPTALAFRRWVEEIDRAALVWDRAPRQQTARARAVGRPLIEQPPSAPARNPGARLVAYCRAAIQGIVHPAILETLDAVKAMREELDADPERSSAVTFSRKLTSLVDSTGTLQNRYAYDRWGNAIASGTSGSVPNPFRYAGAMLDSSTGLYKMGERYYDPSIGRFTQDDPAGGGYGYVQGNPVNLVDPEGTNPLLVACAGGAGGNVAIDWGTALLTGSHFGWRDALKSAGEGCILGVTGFGATELAGKVASKFFWKGNEIVHVSKDFRVAPFGHGRSSKMRELGQKNKLVRRLPHYHRRGRGGIGRHRPWQKGPGGPGGHF